MNNKTPQLSFSITKSVSEIPEHDWERLFGKDLIEGYGYQKTLEECQMPEFSFSYLIGKDTKETVLIIPFFRMEFSFDSLTKGLAQKVIRKLKKFLTFRVIFLGAPTTEEFYLGLTKKCDLKTTLDEAFKYLTAYCRAQKINAFIFNNLAKRDKNKDLIAYLKKRRFIAMETLPNTLIEIKAKSLSEYIDALRPNMRKDLNKKLRRSGECSRLKTELREDIKDIINEIYALYMHNFDDAQVRFEILTKDFFANICRNMPGVAKYFVTYDNNRIVAFNLFLVKDGVYIDKFVGFDPEVAQKYHLYFTTFCHNMDWCIKNNFRYYQPGITDYHPKVRLGAKLVPLFIYAKSPNPLLDFSVRLLAPFITPKNLDPELKEIEKRLIRS